MVYFHRNNMKKNYIFISILILIGITLIVRLHLQTKTNVNSSATSSNKLTLRETTLASTKAKTKPQSKAAVDSKSITPDNAVMEYLKKIDADPEYDWKQSINFYGRVVDENNNPIAGANAHFQWTDLSPNGTSQADAQSDNNGFFSLLNRTGKYMTVDVNKGGYYTYPSERLRGFEYANPADGLFKPDRMNPVVFHLRKKGVGIDLITSQTALSPDLAIHIPKDGTPVMIDFIQKKSGSAGQLEISEMKPEYKDWKQATNWEFRIEIPGGGLVGESDEFPFEAPENDYEPVIDFQFQKGSFDWTTDLKTNFYIKFGNPPLYGRLQIQTGIS